MLNNAKFRKFSKNNKSLLIIIRLLLELDLVIIIKHIKTQQLSKCITE